MLRRKRMAPYLGKNKLRWCFQDNIPILQEKKCPNCGKNTTEVNVTPPGDVKPVFKKELEYIRKIIDKDYGIGLGNLLFPEGKIYLMNKIPGIDFTAEIIANGKIYGRYEYDLERQDHFFKPKIVAGKKLLKLAQKNRKKLRKTIEISTDAVPFIIDGKSILAPGVIGFADDIEKNEHCIVINNNRYITMAKSLANSDEISKMVKEGYGKVARNLKKNIDKTVNTNENKKKKFQIGLKNGIKTDHIQKVTSKSQSWEFVYDVNREYMENLVGKAENFIRNTCIYQGNGKQIAVAYSGGKDSLTTLLLVYKVLGPNFWIFFADTGLEFPEVLENTKKISILLKMEDKLIIKSAGLKFWELIETFGPPARDYRFCCHALKAQQITDIIQKISKGNKILSFLGQRRYESFSRSKEKKIYVNSFIPLQIIATPIKDWNALEVWLYIFHHPHDINGKRVEVPVTPLYFEGFNRLGCFLCPATSISSFNKIREIHPELMEKWDKWLENYSKKHGFSEEWEKFGLWRFKNFGGLWRDFFKKMGIESDISMLNRDLPIKVSIIEEFSPCSQSGFTLKGKVNTALDLNLIASISPIINGKKEILEDSGVFTVESKDYEVNIFANGTFYIHVNEENYKFDKLKQKVIGIIVKSHRCNGCGICERICPENIISIQHDEKKDIFYPLVIAHLSDKCVKCAKCITHCPIYHQIKDFTA
ncbi:MAG: phosphoadenosine phosphosulfate reductase domain-containing protein [Promethearchaeota archaeon]